MTDILCKWLNDDVHLSRRIDTENFATEFSSGYLIGEVLCKYALQEDFTSFSQTSTADSKLNNFTRIEPTMALLGVPFDTNVAKEIMKERPGIATRLLYQLFIELGKKTKLKLTGIAIETMRASAPAKLANIESDIYKERLKTIVPRQVDLNFENLVAKYNARQKEQQEKFIQARMEEEGKIKKYQQHMRNQSLQRSKQIRDRQGETMAKIREATIKIPKPPPSKKNGRNRAELLKEKITNNAKNDIETFQNRLKTALPPMSPLDVDKSDVDVDVDIFVNGGDALKLPTITSLVKPALNDDYVQKIRTRLNEDAYARKEREKRRRRVLIEQLKSNEAQEEAHREEMLVNRLMRQSQMERRIAVQLMHVRHEKEVLKKNRMSREHQFMERRLKDFSDALEREAESCRQARLQYGEEIKKNKELHNKIAEERAKAKYQKHYTTCKQVLLEIVDFSCKVGEYRELTERLLPPKLVREWKALFVEGKPLYTALPTNESDELNEEDLRVEEQKINLLDEEDFKEYKEFIGEWKADEESEIKGPPVDNAVLGHILRRLFNVVYPPKVPPTPPQFPQFPIKACVLGKFFCGKTTAAQQIAATHRVTVLNIDDLTEEAVEAYKNKDIIPEEDTIGEQAREIESPSQDVKKEEESTIKSPTNQPLTANPANDVEVEHSKRKEVLEQTVDKVETPDDTKSFENAKPSESPPSPTSKMAPPSPMLTSRAKLGGKVFNFLKKGKSIPDSLLVDIMVEAVRTVPEGTGWIMDDFPVTLIQAKLLEKSLTGVDPSLNPTKSQKDAKKQMKKSRLAPDPHPSPEGQPYKSGFDLVVLFDIDDETVLRRAEGRTYNPENAEEYHQEFNPPPDGSYTGIQTQAKVEPVLDPSNEREQVQTRLTGFQDSWPKLEKWYTKFSTLHKIDVSKTRDEVYQEVSAILEETVHKLHGPVEEDKPKEPEKIAEEEEEKKTEDTPQLEVESQKPTEVTTAPVSESKIPKSKDKDSKPGSSKGKKGKGKDGRSSSGTPKKVGKDAKEKRGKGHRSPSPKKKGDGTPTRGSRSPSPSKPGSRSGSRGSRRGSKGRKSPLIEESEEPPAEPQGPPEPEPGSAEWEYVNLPIDGELAEMLVYQWQNVEKTYIDSSKHVFRQLRDERENIYRYFYQTRKSFVQYLMRPDIKQEFVEQWQKDYNEVSEDTRDDIETKQELNQRVEDLCERLWDICDTRKEEADSERVNIMKEGWQEDHIGLLTNHYVSLMQGELDRYQESCKLLKDYYVGMEGGPGLKKVKQLSETDLTISRLPLVDLPPTLPPGSEIESPQQEVKPLSAKTSKEKDPKIVTPEGEEDEENKRRIPLIPRRPKSADAQTAGKEKKEKRSTPKREKTQVSDDKLDSPIPPADPDERLLFDAYSIALQFIEGQNASLLADEETEALRQADLEKEKEKEVHKITTKKSKKGGRKSGEKSRSPTRTHPQDSHTPTPAADENTDVQNEEENLKKLMLEKARKEYKGSILSEGNGLRMRLELIKAQSTGVMQDLKAKAEQSYKDMNDWLGERFLQEMDSIDCLAKAAREAIEKEEKLQTEFVLEDKDLIVDLDFITFKTPSPPPPPSPKEVAFSDTFTVIQLMELYKQFMQLSPSGLIAVKAFCDTFLELASCPTGTEPLPDNWMSVTLQQLQELCNLLSTDREYIDWRSFLVCAAKPWMSASKHDLLDALERFKELDQLGIGKIKWEEYEEVPLWFLQPNDPQANVDPDEPPTYNRTKDLHKAFFDIFADIDEGVEAVDYTNMLLYFCVTQHPLEGFLRALSIVTGKPMPSKDELDFKLQEFEENLPILKNQISPPELLTDISLDHLLMVFNHGKRFVGDDNRFSTTPHPVNLFSKERLTAIFAELGAAEDEIMPLYLLYQHPVMRDCIHMCERYRFVDIKSLIKPLEVSTADPPGN